MPRKRLLISSLTFFIEYPMEKVIILAYNFPPSERTSSQRAYTWARYLHKYGYYPVIITRNWDLPMKTHEDQYKSSGTDIKHEIKEDYEVYYLPYQGTVRDDWSFRYGQNPLFKIYSKVYTATELSFRCFSDFFIPYSNFYTFSREYLRKHKDVKKMIVTIFPFFLLKFAHKLHMEFDIKWIADYRDDWSTSELHKNEGGVLNTLLNGIEARKEKKWLSSASFFTSVSPYYVKKIGRFLDKEANGHVLYNGFFAEELKNYANYDHFEDFTITYNGTLYPSQHIELVLTAIQRIIKEYADKVRIRLLFPGLAAISSQAKRVKEFMTGFEDNLKIFERIPKKEVMIMQKRSHLLLMVAHGGVKGVTSSKIFEYIGLGKKVLVCPTDNDVIEEILTETKLGICVKTEEEAYENIKMLVNQFLSSNAFEDLKETDQLSKFSRESQTAIMAKLLDAL